MKRELFLKTEPWPGLLPSSENASVGEQCFLSNPAASG